MLQDLDAHEPGIGQPGCDITNDHASTRRAHMHLDMHIDQSRAAAVETAGVWDNPTLATQLVIGCYATTYKARGMVIQGIILEPLDPRQ